VANGEDILPGLHAGMPAQREMMLFFQEIGAGDNELVHRLRGSARDQPSARSDPDQPAKDGGLLARAVVSLAAEANQHFPGLFSA
jgi:hypothetical protein